MYAYAKNKDLGPLEEFITGTHLANLQSVGDRCFEEGLYEAARVIYTRIPNYGRLASTLVRLHQFQAAVDAARKVGGVGRGQRRGGLPAPAPGSCGHGPQGGQTGGQAGGGWRVQYGSGGRGGRGRAGMSTARHIIPVLLAFLLCGHSPRPAALLAVSLSPAFQRTLAARHAPVAPER